MLRMCVMAVPKKKSSVMRQRMRSASKRVEPLQMAWCPECGEERLPHHLCLQCGLYRGRKVWVAPRILRAAKKKDVES